MIKFTTEQLQQPNSPDYINDIMLLQLLVSERSNKLDLHNPLLARMRRLAIELDQLKQHRNVETIIKLLPK